MCVCVYIYSYINWTLLLISPLFSPLWNYLLTLFCLQSCWKLIHPVSWTHREKDVVGHNSMYMTKSQTTKTGRGWWWALYESWTLGRRKEARTQSGEVRWSEERGADSVHLSFMAGLCSCDQLSHLGLDSGKPQISCLWETLDWWGGQSPGLQGTGDLWMWEASCSVGSFMLIGSDRRQRLVLILSTTKNLWTWFWILMEGQRGKKETLSPGLQAPARAREQSHPPPGTTTLHPWLLHPVLGFCSKRSKTKLPPDHFHLKKPAWLRVALKIKRKAA